MSGLQALIVAGTHGNEVNAPWLLNQWKQKPDSITTHDLKVVPVIGNPLALAAGKRYLDRDLNRSFSPEFLGDSSCCDREVLRAKELLSLYGFQGSTPCHVAIDIHSTTACMGTSLVVYGRRPADLALAALIQHLLGLPVYLHEGDKTQVGFLVESWPCGLVIEIGPVPQGLLDFQIIRQTQLALEACLESLSRVGNQSTHYPDYLIVHRHVESIDFPRDLEDQPDACIHESLYGKDWFPLEKGTALFQKLDGSVIRYSGNDSLIPVFVNEASYAEKRIAFSLTKREVWLVNDEWKLSINQLKSLV